jgi:hypothetical protein
LLAPAAGTAAPLTPNDANGRSTVRDLFSMAFEIPSDLMVSVSGVRGRVGEG